MEEEIMKPWEKYASTESTDEGPWNRYETSAPIVPSEPEAPRNNNLARQAGLTARIGVETIGDLGTGALGLLNKAFGPRQDLMQPELAARLPQGNPFEGSGSRFADVIGLPRPENAVERVVNETGRIIAPTGATIKAASTLERMASSPLTKRIMQSISANPAGQLQAATGAGSAGGTAREMGASPEIQFASALGGGLVAPLLARGGGFGAQAMAQPGNVSAQQVDIALNNAVPQFANLPLEVQNALRVDAANALKQDGALSNDALRRLSDYRLVGAQPMRSSLTLNPADVTRDQNLVKMSANSSDPAAQTLANVRGDNQKKIIDFINKRGAQNASTPYNAGNTIVSNLQSFDDIARGNINNLYSQARNTAGRSAEINPRTFTETANNLLDDALLGGKLPGDVRNKLNSIAQGTTPLTVDVAEQFKTNIGTLQRASNDPAERLALAKVREALDEAPLLDGQGQGAIDAFNKARDANRKYMQFVENTPALKAVRDGIEPDKFVSQFITGPKSTVKEMENLRRIVKDSPEALDEVRAQILQSLKLKGTNGASDEVASFSPSPYNKELSKIGDAKLRIFFNQEEVDALKALGRVASYEKFQPTGSAVNNSNTAATLFMSTLERLGASGLLRKIPLGNIAANQANDIALSINARNTLNPANALTSPVVNAAEPVPGVGLGIGLLSAPTE
jgi:hypothetical protein